MNKYSAYFPLSQMKLKKHKSKKSWEKVPFFKNFTRRVSTSNSLRLFLAFTAKSTLGQFCASADHLCLFLALRQWVIRRERGLPNQVVHALFVPSPTLLNSNFFNFPIKTFLTFIFTSSFYQLSRHFWRFITLFAKKDQIRKLTSIMEIWIRTKYFQIIRYSPNQDIRLLVPREHYEPCQSTPFGPVVVQ